MTGLGCPAHRIVLKIQHPAVSQSSMTSHRVSQPPEGPDWKLQSAGGIQDSQRSKVLGESLRILTPQLRKWDKPPTGQIEILAFSRIGLIFSSLEINLRKNTSFQHIAIDLKMSQRVVWLPFNFSVCITQHLDVSRCIQPNACEISS